MVCPGNSHRDSASHSVFCFLGDFRASASDGFDSSVAGFLGDRAGIGFGRIFETPRLNWIKLEEYLRRPVR